MHIILYLDILFILNLVVDLYGLILTGYIVKQQMNRVRLLGGAMFGAGMLLPFMMCPESLIGIKGLFWSAGISMGAVWIALGRQGGLIRKWVLTTTILMGLGGIMNYLQMRWRITFISLGIWMIFFISCASALWILTACARDVLHKGNVLCSVQISLGEKTKEGMVLLDTGNRLRDGLFGKPVIVMSDHFLGDMFTEEERRLIQSYQKNGYLDYSCLISLETQKKMCFHEIAYRSVGNPSGKMLCFLAEQIVLSDKNISLTRQPVAIGSDAIFAEAVYDGLLFADGWE